MAAPLDIVKSLLTDKNLDYLVLEWDRDQDKGFVYQLLLTRSNDVFEYVIHRFNGDIDLVFEEGSLSLDSTLDLVNRYIKRASYIQGEFIDGREVFKHEL